MSAQPERKLSEVKPITPMAQRDPVAAAKAHAVALRKRRKDRLLRRLAAFVVVPTVLAAIYFLGIASNQYESFATFTVQSSELRPTLGMEGLLAGLAPGGGGHDALTVRDYLLSRDMLSRLDREQGFIAHYKDKSRDVVSRLRASATFEEAFEYFGHKVTAEVEPASGSVVLRVRAFSPEKAAKLTQAIMSYSEEMVNKLSERERRDRTAYAEADVAKAEQRLSQARGNIVTLQQKHADFNPLQTATATITLRTQLEGELAKARAELMQLKSYMNDDAPQVRAVNEKVKAISAQVSGESQRLVNGGKSGGISGSLADFEGAMVEKEFAQKRYESAMAQLEMARADASRQHRYLAIIATPSKPDESTYPHRIRSILAAFALSFLLLGTVGLIGAAVREHARL